MHLRKILLLSGVILSLSIGGVNNSFAQGSSSVPGKLADKVCCKKKTVPPPKPKPLPKPITSNSVQFNKSPSVTGASASRPNKMAVAAKQLRERQATQQAISKAKLTTQITPVNASAPATAQAAVTDLKKINTSKLPPPQKAEVGGALHKAEQNVAATKKSQIKANSNKKSSIKAHADNKKLTETKQQNKSASVAKKRNNEALNQKKFDEDKRFYQTKRQNEARARKTVASQKFSSEQKSKANSALEKQFPNYSKRVDKNKANISTASINDQYLVPRNIQDQKNLRQALSNPKAVKSFNMNDSRVFHSNDGWVKKKSFSVSGEGNKSQVSFQYNQKTDKIADIKFENYFNPSAIKRTTIVENE